MSVRTRVMSFALVLLFPALARAAEPAPAACLIGAHPGIGDADAETAASLVCEELARLGHPVGAPALQPGALLSAYRVELRPLGSSVFLTLAREAPIGTTVATRRVQLANLSEVAVAAPRIADALVAGRELGASATVDNLVGEETRAYRKRSGEFLWGIGIGGTGFAGAGGGLSPNLALVAQYQGPRFAIDTDLHIAIPTGGCIEDACSDNTLVSWGLGARYFFTDGDFSPYAGGGLALGLLDVQSANFYGDQFGVGAYLRVGVEVLRTHAVRLAFDLRADIPFFGIEEYSFDSSATASKYVVPVTLGATFTW